MVSSSQDVTDTKHDATATNNNNRTTHAAGASRVDATVGTAQGATEDDLILVDGVVVGAAHGGGGWWWGREDYLLWKIWEDWKMNERYDVIDSRAVCWDSHCWKKLGKRRHQ